MHSPFSQDRDQEHMILATNPKSNISKYFVRFVASVANRSEGVIFRRDLKLRKDETPTKRIPVPHS